MPHSGECSHRNQTHEDKKDQFIAKVIPKVQWFRERRKAMKCKGRREYLNIIHTRVEREIIRISKLKRGEVPLIE
jgi:hypothetical protein